MKYTEFIERTNLGENKGGSGITIDDYTWLIEPYYMVCDESAEAFCARFYKLYQKYVGNAVSMLAYAKDRDFSDVGLYIDEEMTIQVGVSDINILLKSAFLQIWHRYGF